MKNNMLKDLLVVGSVATTLLFVQPVQGQSLLSIQDVDNVNLNELRAMNMGEGRYLPMQGTSEQVSSCFDLTKLGERYVIRCFNHNVQMDTLSKNPLKISIYWDGGFGEDRSGMAHPRQTLMSSTTQKDDIVPSLSVIPTNGQYSIRCGADSYGVNDLTAKGSSTGFYQTVQQANPVLMIISAAILEKTDHTIAKQGLAEAEQAQPRIKLYAVDLTDNKYLDCPSLEYLPYTNPSSVTGGKWKIHNDGGGRDFYWKDWDTTYLDMSSYVGHQLVFFYETYDCNVSGMTKSKIDGKPDSIVLCTKHETARLYVTMDCAPKPSVSQICKGAKTELVVPAGWEGYKWKKGNDYISGETSNKCLVSATEKATYTCELKSLCTTTKITSTVTPLTDIVNKSIIQGGSVEIDGHTYTEAGNEEGTWTHIRHTSDDECDVVVTVNLTVTSKTDPVHVYYERTIPQGVVFDFYGQDLTTEGEYMRACKTTTGNDSIVHLNLHIQGETPKVDDEACFHMSTIGTTAAAPTVAVESNLIKQTAYISWDMKIPSTPKRETYLTKEGLDELCPDLSLLPPGESTSVRLASEKYGAGDMAKGSAVVFRYTIDANHPYVNIKYAGVLETPGHSIATMSGFKEFAQPYMTIYWTIDGVEMEHRSYFPSDANSVKAWKSFTDRHGNKAIWLDWQSVRLDLSQHVGKTFGVAMEVYDCAEENYDAANKQIEFCSHHHLARGYCHVNCEAKKEDMTNVAITKSDDVQVQSVARCDGTHRLELITDESGTYSLYDVCGRVIQSGYFGQEYGIMEIGIPTATSNIFIIKFVTNSGQQNSKKLMIY